MRSLLHYLLLTSSVAALVRAPPPTAVRRSTPRHAVVSASLPTTLAYTALRGGAVALPAVPALVTASVVPTALGFWKSGYAVSYGYGAAMAAAGLLTLRSNVGVLAAAHASALCFYGVRLVAFLLYRELCLPEAVHQMKRRDATLGARLKRTPVVVGCSALYFCMAAPLRVTARAAGTLGPSATAATAVAITLAFTGFGIAAVGDLWKSVVKARRGAGHLVTSGPFARLRHPNYTGECFGWTASFFAAVVAACGSGGAGPAATGWLAASAVGWLGIMFVLAGEATAGLEKKQQETYGGTAEYDAWVKRSWAGPMVPA